MVKTGRLRVCLVFTFPAGGLALAQVEAKTRGRTIRSSIRNAVSTIRKAYTSARSGASGGWKRIQFSVCYREEERNPFRLLEKDRC